MNQRERPSGKVTAKLSKQACAALNMIMASRKLNQKETLEKLLLGQIDADVSRRTGQHAGSSNTEELLTSFQQLSSEIENLKGMIEPLKASIETLRNMQKYSVAASFQTIRELYFYLPLLSGLLNSSISPEQTRALATQAEDTSIKEYANMYFSIIKMELGDYIKALLKRRA